MAALMAHIQQQPRAPQPQPNLPSELEAAIVRAGEGPGAALADGRALLDALSAISTKAEAA